MSKNKVMLAIASLENDDALMRLDKVSAAVAMLKEAHLEIPNEVKTGPVPNIGEIRAELQKAVADLDAEITRIREKYPELKEFIGE